MSPSPAEFPDVHAAVIGSGAVNAYDTHLAVSTTAWLSARVLFKRTDILHSIATLPGMDPTMNLVGNNIETGGAALSWLREQIIAPQTDCSAVAAASERTAPHRSSNNRHTTPLTALAATAPAGCEGLIFTPWLAGERSPIEDKNLRAARTCPSAPTGR